jgi:uncharacterized glyoxalase superfamily protein PhnB
MHVRKKIAMESASRCAAGTIAPTLRYRDVQAAIGWLCQAFGFEERRVLLSANGAVQYAELAFGDGMILLGTAEDPSIDRVMTQPDATGGLETQICYLFVPNARTHRTRAEMAGAEIVLNIEDGSKQGYSCRDLEGHIWNFGTYDPRQGRSLGVSKTGRLQTAQRSRVGRLTLFSSLLVNAMTSIAFVALAILADDRVLSPAYASASLKELVPGWEARALQTVAHTMNPADDEELVRERNAREAADRNALDAREQLLAHERSAREASERAAKEARDQLASALGNSARLETAIAELRKTIAPKEVATPALQEKREQIAKIAIERMRNKYINLEGYKTHSGKTYAQCEQLCLVENKCVAIEFNRRDRTCELLDRLETPLADADADVGIKRFH